MPNLDIFSRIAPKELTAYFDDLPPRERPNYFGETLFPNRYTNKLTMSFLRGRAPTQIALNLSSYDSKPPTRERFRYQRTWYEIPFFREAFLIKEEEYAELLRVQRGEGTDSDVADIIDRYYDDTTELFNAGRIQREAMRMQLLGNPGTITLRGAGSRADYDFKFPNANKFAPTNLWSDHVNSDPIGDLQRWRETLWENTGEWATLAILSPETWKHLTANEKIQNGILLRYGTAAGTATAVSVNIPPSAYAEYIRSNLDNGVVGSGNLEFYVYDKVYRPSSESPLISIYPDNAISLLPSGTLGYTWWSDTPESLRNQDGRPGQLFGMATNNDGITISQMDNVEPPITMKTWGSMVSIPSFDLIDKCGWAKVA